MPINRDYRLPLNRATCALPPPHLPIPPPGGWPSHCYCDQESELPRNVSCLLAVVCCCAAWRTEAESCSRSAVQTKAVLTVEQPGEQQGALLLLWGPAMDWLPGFSRDKGAVGGSVSALETF